MSDGTFSHSYAPPARPDTGAGRRKLLLVPAILCNLAIVIMECIAFRMLWQVDSTFSHQVIFYTNQSNFFALICSALFVLIGTAALFRDGRIPHGLHVFRLMCSVMLYNTFIVILYGFVATVYTAGPGAFAAMYGGSMFVMHLLAPLVSVASLLFFEGEPLLTLGDTVTAVLYTYLYSIVMVILNAAGKVDGPYPFLQVDVNPWYVSLLYAVILLPGAYLVSLCGKWLSNGIAGRLSGEKQ